MKKCVQIFWLFSIFALLVACSDKPTIEYCKKYSTHSGGKLFVGDCMDGRIYNGYLVNPDNSLWGIIEKGVLVQSFSKL
jgi:hypothetical protein